MEPEDILSTSLEVLYDYTPIVHSSAGSLFTYTIKSSLSSANAPPQSITLRTPDTQSRNWSLHASSIWVSSIHLADHIDRLRLSSIKPITVLELGAGAGLPGILISICYENVLVTTSDFPDDLLIRTLSENVERNLAHKCRVVPYAWGSDVSVLGIGGDDENAGFDVIVAADTLWNSELHHPFIETLRMTLKKTAEARIHLVAGLHTGRYTLQAFMDAIERSEFVFEDITEKDVNREVERKWDVTRAEDEDEKERRRWVVWMTLKWKQIEPNIDCAI
jgi:nicotinamide N-methyltransferase